MDLENGAADGPYTAFGMQEGVRRERVDVRRARDEEDPETIKRCGGRPRHWFCAVRRGIEGKPKRVKDSVPAPATPPASRNFMAVSPPRCVSSAASSCSSCSFSSPPLRLASRLGARVGGRAFGLGIGRSSALSDTSPICATVHQIRARTHNTRVRGRGALIDYGVETHLPY